MREFDIILFGATSFVGAILTKYMLSQQPLDGDVKWAIAGRSQTKLNQLKLSLGEAAEALPVIVADTCNPASIDAMCGATRVIVSTVGPYALYGEPVIQSCVALGTDYCDLTGEPQWIHKMLGRYEAAAKKSGARIVNCCGFDSIPSDLGVYFLQQKSNQTLKQHCNSVKMRVKAMKGGASGGTIASMLNAIKEAMQDKNIRKIIASPYALCPTDHGFKARQINLKSAQYDKDVQAWIAPFVMAAINVRVVHRSNALLHKQYGENFLYEEAMITGPKAKGGISAAALTAGLGGFMLAAILPPTRWLMEKTILPKPGEGPSPQAQRDGYYDLRFIGTTQDGQTIRCKVTGDSDPGYGSTAKMLGQAALCLAQDMDEKPGGFWTPASLFGEKIISRLETHAGLTFNTE